MKENEKKKLSNISKTKSWSFEKIKLTNLLYTNKERERTQNYREDIATDTTEIQRITETSTNNHTPRHWTTCKN